MPGVQSQRATNDVTQYDKQVAFDAKAMSILLGRVNLNSRPNREDTYAAGEFTATLTIITNAAGNRCFMYDSTACKGTGTGKAPTTK